MQNYEISQTIADVHQIKQAINNVFEGYPDAIDWLDVCERTISDLNDIRDNRGLDETIVAVIGHKNAGKSFFCQSVLKNQNDIDKVKTGSTTRYSTTKLLWIGASKPKRLNSDLEEYLDVEKENLVTFKKPYVLVDVPGFNDINAEAQNIAHKIIAIASVVVLVVKWDNGFDLDSQFRYLSHGNGLTIIPVIVDHKFGYREEQEAKEQSLKFEAELRKRFGHDRVSQAVYVPQWGTYPIEEQTYYKNKAIELNQMILKKALDAKQVERSFIAHTLYSKTLILLRERMQSVIQNIHPSYDALKQKEAATVTELTTRLTGSDDAFEYGIRVRMMSKVVEKTSRSYIPFRSIMGLLSITSGAWDKLTLSFAGSLPSLAMVLFQSGKNVKNIHEHKTQIRKNLSDHLDDVYQRNLNTAQHDFISALNNYNQQVIEKESINWQDLKNTDKQLILLENIADEQINENIEKEVGKAKLVNAIGLIATFIFMILLLGPFTSIYNQYISTGFSSFLFGGVVWQDFPAPSFSMISFSLLLSVIPVFILGVIAMSITVRKSVVSNCASESKKSIKLKFSFFIEESMERFYAKSFEKRKNFEFINNLISNVDKKNKNDIE